MSQSMNHIQPVLHLGRNGVRARAAAALSKSSLVIAITAFWRDAAVQIRQGQPGWQCGEARRVCRHGTAGVRQPLQLEGQALRMRRPCKLHRHLPRKIAWRMVHQVLKFLPQRPIHHAIGRGLPGGVERRGDKARATHRSQRSSERPDGRLLGASARNQVEPGALVYFTVRLNGPALLKLHHCLA